ncbi:MAG: murein biosynthesis integral membrane protein MurJ [Clostridia bacterium]|nr:murein biosynthesis integral membrane protein MurJ [Clostridia bacterium]
MKNSASSKAVRTISFMAVIIFCAKLMGLLRETLIASVYGQGFESDILNTATQIPLLFFDMTLGVAILSTFIPVFNTFLERDGKIRAMKFANSFLATVVIISSLAAIIGMIFAYPLVRLMVPGYSAEKVAATATLLRVLFPSIVFTAAAYTAVGILQSFGEFNIPSIISVVSNLIMILYLVFVGDRFSLLGVVISMVIAWASQLIIQIPHLLKSGWRWSFGFSLRDKGIRDAAKLALPVLISSWIQPLCVVINMAFSSSMGDGAVSGLNWANKIYIIMVGVFAYAVTNFIFPRLSRLGSGSRNNEFKETTRISLGWIIFIIAYVSAMFVALSKPIIKIIFEYGAFSAKNTETTAVALLFYSFGMVGYAICEILNKSFYALRDGKTPMFTAAFGIFMNLVSAFVLVKLFKMGIGGLALASAVSSLAMAMVLLYMINKKESGTITGNFIKNTAKTVASAIVCGIVAFLCYTLLSPDQMGRILNFILCGASAGVALILYLLLSFVLKIDEFDQIRRFIHHEK